MLLEFYQNVQLDMKETSSMLCGESKGRKYTGCMHRVSLGRKPLTALVLMDFLADKETLC